MQRNYLYLRKQRNQNYALQALNLPCSDIPVIHKQNNHNTKNLSHILCSAYR